MKREIETIETYDMFGIEYVYELKKLNPSIIWVSDLRNCNKPVLACCAGQSGWTYDNKWMVLYPPFDYKIVSQGSLTKRRYIQISCSKKISMARYIAEKGNTDDIPFSDKKIIYLLREDYYPQIADVYRDLNEKEHYSIEYDNSLYWKKSVCNTDISKLIKMSDISQSGIKVKNIKNEKHIVLHISNAICKYLDHSPKKGNIDGLNDVYWIVTLDREDVKTYNKFVEGKGHIGLGVGTSEFYEGLGSMDSREQIIAALKFDKATIDKELYKTVPIEEIKFLKIADKPLEDCCGFLEEVSCSDTVYLESGRVHSGTGGRMKKTIDISFWCKIQSKNVRSSYYGVHFYKCCAKMPDGKYKMDFNTTETIFKYNRFSDKNESLIKKLCAGILFQEV